MAWCPQTTCDGGLRGGVLLLLSAGTELNVCSRRKKILACSSSGWDKVSMLHTSSSTEHNYDFWKECPRNYLKTEKQTPAGRLGKNIRLWSHQIGDEFTISFFPLWHPPPELHTARNSEVSSTTQKKLQKNSSSGSGLRNLTVKGRAENQQNQSWFLEPINKIDFSARQTN